MSYTQTFYHIVLRTHRSIPAIVEEHERELYSYMLGFVNNVGGCLYRIGGMPDHVHLFVSLPATLAMSKFVQEIKVSTSKWLNANPHFPLFDGWSKEYAGFSYSLRDKDMIVGYIAKQKEHHRSKTFAEEYRQFLVENGENIKEDYFFKD
ncbi:MAG: transposase [Paludibacteraceae bacterium]|nr:transposase [Paludibacteraceae bacterium]